MIQDLDIVTGDITYFIIFKENHLYFKEGDTFQIAKRHYNDEYSVEFYSKEHYNYFNVSNDVITKISSEKDPEYFV